MKKLSVICLIFLFSIIGFDFAQAGLSDGLVVHYNFDESQGGIVDDESGNGHTGAVYGPSFAADGGVTGGAYTFDGFNDYIVAGDLGYFPNGTISFWIYATAVENWRNPFSTRLFSWDDNIRFEESAAGVFAVGALGMGVGTYTESLEPLRWYHVVYAWDENNGYGYLDGQLVFTTPHPDPASSVHPNLPYTAGYYKERCLNFDNVGVGNGYSTQAERFWKGSVDELRIYNRVLSESEVIKIYQDPENSLIVHFSFDNITGGTVKDESGNGHDAVVIGTPVNTSGISGGALDFKKSDYILAAVNPLAGAEEFTVSVWFKTATPTNNYKIVSAAEWYGGNNASGLLIGTHYTEGWADNQLGSIRGEPNWPRTESFIPGEWNHLVLRYDGATVKEYINGVLATDVLGSGLSVGTGRPLEVGAWSQYSGLNYEGLVDDLRIYNRALDEAEIIKLFSDQELNSKLFLYIQSLLHPATGLVISRDNEDYTTVYKNALAVMALIHEGHMTQSEQILDIFLNHYYAQQGNFPGFTQNWIPSTGEPNPSNPNYWEGDNAFLLLSLNYYSQAVGSINHDYYDLIEGLKGWLCQRADSGDYIAPEGVANMYSALLPYGSEPVVLESLNRLRDRFYATVDYVNVADLAVRGAMMFDDVAGFAYINNFLRTETWDYDLVTEVQAYSAYAAHQYINLEISAQYLLSWKLLGDRISEDLSFLDAQMKQVLLAGIQEPESLGLPYTVTNGNPDSFDDSATLPIIDSSCYLLFYQWGFNPFGLDFNIPGVAPDINIVAYDKIVEAGEQAQIQIQWSNLNPEGYKIVVQLENWNVSPAILHLVEIQDFAPNGTKIVNIDIPAGSNTAAGCKYVVAVLSKTQGWGDVQTAVDSANDVELVAPGTPWIEILSYDLTVEAGDLADINVKWRNLNPDTYKLVAQLENWGVEPVILHFIEMTGFSPDGNQTLQIPVSIDSNTATGCRYVVAALSKTQGWGDVQAVADTPSDVAVTAPMFPSIQIINYDASVHAGSQAHIEVVWTDLNPNDYKLVVQLENWNVQPPILHLSESTGFASSGHEVFSLDIPAGSNTSGGCRYVVAALSKTQGWGDVQAAADTPANVEVLPALAPSLNIVSYPTVVTAGTSIQVELQWQDLNPDGYKIVVQLENWNVQPAILYLSEVTGFASSGSQSVTIQIAPDSNTASGCRFVAAVLSQSQGWGDVQAAFDTQANVEVIANQSKAVKKRRTKAAARRG
ncbi:MAG: LamG domain-containing protein [Chlamydiota bacterium]|nr:LamG domain-containing protein [Chlamydiota bacterium]